MDAMNELERQLKNVLAREEAPPWFEARVMARTSERRIGFAAQPRWAAALASTVLIVCGAAWTYERAAEERAAGEAAKARLELALKITSAKLEQIQQKVVHQND